MVENGLVWYDLVKFDLVWLNLVWLNLVWLSEDFFMFECETWTGKKKNINGGGFRVVAQLKS